VSYLHCVLDFVRHKFPYIDAPAVRAKMGQKLKDVRIHNQTAAATAASAAAAADGITAGAVVRPN